ncbi:MAG TPA: transposase [Nitrososphaerales archaeon]|nr:transposase [Nitrososphaerales archaeon]
MMYPIGGSVRAAFRFRLYPSRKQEVRMLRALEAARKLWNDALGHRKQRWNEKRLPTSYVQQCSILTAQRRADPELAELYAQSAQEVLHRLDKAFKSFFEHRACYPRFKKFRQTGSFTYPQAYNGSVKPDIVRKRLFVSKIGNLRVVFHRPLPRASLLKTCTVSREPNWMWFASLVFEEVVPLQDVILPASAFIRSAKSPIGVDLGLLSLITTSDGARVEHPRFLRKAERRLKYLQSALSNKKKGSKNRFRARQRVASQHSKVRRQRLDFNHKISTKLVREHDFIAFEDLRVRNMIQNAKLAKSIQDAGWGQLVTLTEYKAMMAGSLVVKVPAPYSTKECHHCGTLNKVALSVREFVCSGCGRTLQRDPNAACVVLKRGLAIAGLTTAAKVGQDMPELKPVETRPLLLPTYGGASQVCEAGTICVATDAGSPRVQPREDVTLIL